MPMQCLRCGKETGADAAFCPECLETMEDYPVPPGTPVVIPARSARKTAPRPRDVPYEVQIARLRQQLRRLRIAAAALAAALALTLALFLVDIWNHQQEKPDIGRNYSTAESSTPPSGT